MTDFQRTLHLRFLLVIGLLFLSPLRVMGSSWDTGISSQPVFSDSLQTHTADVYARHFETPGKPHGGGDAFRDMQSQSSAIHLAQTLPFQAPATPDIESEVRSTRPTGKGSQGELSPATQKDQTQGRTVAPPSSTSKKRRPDAKQRSSSSSEPSLGKKPVAPPGFQSLNQPAFSPRASSSSSLPPLPPAMPYTPPAGAHGTGPVIAPRPQDTLPPPSPPSGGLTKPNPSARGFPSATPVGPGGSLDNFVLDSFGTGQGTVPSGQTTDQKVPPATLFGQLSQDVKQLGDNIRETFRSLLSLR